MLTNTQLESIKKEVFRKCEENNYRPLRITILGSYSIGTNNEYSDIDLHALIILPLKYYIGDHSLRYNNLMEEFEQGVKIEGIDKEINIHYIDIISKMKELHYEYQGNLIEIILDGMVIYGNNSLEELFSKIYDYRKHLIQLKTKLNNYIREIDNNHANGKVACRIIRDIARTKQLLKDKTYDYNITLDEMIQGDAIFESILSRQRAGDIVFLTDEESSYFKQTIKYLIKQIEKENEYYDEYESVEYDDELTQYLMNVVMEHNKDALRISE